MDKFHRLIHTGSPEINLEHENCVCKYATKQVACYSYHMSYTISTTANGLSNNLNLNLLPQTQKSICFPSYKLSAHWWFLNRFDGAFVQSFVKCPSTEKWRPSVFHLGTKTRVFSKSPMASRTILKNSFFSGFHHRCRVNIPTYHNKSLSFSLGNVIETVFISCLACYFVLMETLIIITHFGCQRCHLTPQKTAICTITIKKAANGSSDD